MNEYIKSKINNNKIDNINCPNNRCDNIISDYFIEQFLIKKDIPLLDKYKKFKNKNQLIINPDIQLCPFPDCESYAKKNKKNKYVTCMKGHKFCSKCLKNWHGNEKCKNEVDKDFEKWKNAKKVKKCPRCKFYIEKNEGCNHMTCTSCRYEWCWICQKEYTPNHYEEGNCEGLLYNNNSSKCKIIFRILKMMLFYVIFPFVFVGYGATILVEREINDLGRGNCEFIQMFIFFFIFFAISLMFYILLFSIGNIFMIIMLIYWPFQRKVIRELFG